MLRKVVVTEALEALSPAHREVLNETILRDRSVNEAAEVLIAVSRDGTRHTVMGWRVPVWGYGVPGSPGSLRVHGGTAVGRADLARFDVRVEGSDRILLSIRVWSLQPRMGSWLADWFRSRKRGSLVMGRRAVRNSADARTSWPRRRWIGERAAQRGSRGGAEFALSPAP